MPDIDTKALRDYALESAMAETVCKYAPSDVRRFAEEIDRLRAENAELCARNDFLDRIDDEGAELRAENAKLREALAFARCTIMSGEAWSQTCRDVINGALALKEDDDAQG